MKCCARRSSSTRTARSSRAPANRGSTSTASSSSRGRTGRASPHRVSPRRRRPPATPEGGFAPGYRLWAMGSTRDERSVTRARRGACRRRAAVRTLESSSSVRGWTSSCSTTTSSPTCRRASVVAWRSNGSAESSRGSRRGCRFPCRSRSGRSTHDSTCERPCEGARAVKPVPPPCPGWRERSRSCTGRSPFSSSMRSGSSRRVPRSRAGSTRTSKGSMRSARMPSPRNSGRGPSSGTFGRMSSATGISARTTSRTTKQVCQTACSTSTTSWRAPRWFDCRYFPSYGAIDEHDIRLAHAAAALEALAWRALDPEAHDRKSGRDREGAIAWVRTAIVRLS